MLCHCQLGMEFWTPHACLQTPPEGPRLQLAGEKGLAPHSIL